MILLITIALSLMVIVGAINFVISNTKNENAKIVMGLIFLFLLTSFVRFLVSP